MAGIWLTTASVSRQPSPAAGMAQDAIASELAAGDKMTDLPDGKTLTFQRPGRSTGVRFDPMRKDGCAPKPARRSKLGRQAQLNQIPRQLGLAARYAIEGPAQAAEIITEPIRQNITDPLARLLFCRLCPIW